MNKKILVATFALWKDNKRTCINGMIEPLLSFFLSKTQNLDLIDGPHSGSSTVTTKFESYQKGQLKEKTTSWTSFILKPFLKFHNTDSTHLFFKFRDFLSVLELALRRNSKYDLFIGLESVYTLSGILLKKFGRVKTVVYYVSDYSPNRYSNKLFNNLYLKLDKLCCYCSDYIWDVSPAMQPARIKAGLKEEHSSPTILVPNALFPDQIKFLPLNQLKPFSLVYAGTFGPENGVPLAISAMRKVIKKFPEAKLHLLGGSHSFEKDIIKLVKKYNLNKHIVFYGFISDTTKLSNIISQFRIGLAPYMAFPNSARWYADATKLRLYLGAGLPVITTHVPPLGKEVKEKGAGIIVKDNPPQLANAIIDLLSNEAKYKKMRKAAIKFAKENTWENSYKNAFTQMQAYY